MISLPALLVLVFLIAVFIYAATKLPAPWPMIFYIVIAVIALWFIVAILSGHAMIATTGRL